MCSDVSWVEFRQIASELIATARKEHSCVLFRGHGSDQWSLQTTLERSDHERGVMDYYRLILRNKFEVEAYTGLRWQDKPTVPQLSKKLNSTDFDAFLRLMRENPHYSYMVYLRHHGFPSPLLDWSNSPYVASYFAFDRLEIGASRVAIYAYRERPNRFKLGGSDEPFIHQLGPYTSGPKRHFAQRSQYTICIDWDRGNPHYASHDEVCKPFDQNAQFQQDVIYKFTLPVADRRDVLRELEVYNLNAFTLFGSEESLLRSISQREEDCVANPIK